jgi:hypothetical protein
MEVYQKVCKTPALNVSLVIYIKLQLCTYAHMKSLEMCDLEIKEEKKTTHSKH